MKKRWISLLLILVLVMAAGCGKKNTTKKVKTEDLDEATLQGMAKENPALSQSKMIIYQCLKNEMGVKPRKPNKEGFKVYEKDIKEISCGWHCDVCKEH